MPAARLVALLLLACATSAQAAPDPHWSDRFATPGVDGFILCAAPYKGGIAIGGRFSYVSGIPAHNVAWWDGAHWQALGTGTDGDVTSLIEFGEQLVVTGHFTLAGGNVANGAATWNVGHWAAMGEGLDVPLAHPATGAKVLAIFRGELYAGGDFERSGANALHYVARWDGSAWRDVAGGVDRGSVTSFAVLNNRLYMGGGFSRAGNVPANGVARWDGVEWRALGTGTRRLGQAAPVLALAIVDNQLAVGGDFDSAGTVAAKNIAVTDGFDWRALGEGHDGAVRALAGLGNKLLVGPTHETSARLWDGFAWTYATPGLFGVANGYFYLGGLVAFGDVWAYEDFSLEPTASGLVRQQGDAWHGFETFNERTNGLGPWRRISALARVPGGILAAGSFSRIATPDGWLQADRLARWDGTRWRALPPLPLQGAVGAILVHGDTIEVGGSFFDVWHGPSGITPVLRLVGSSWERLGTLSLAVSAMRIYRGELVIGGQRVSIEDPDIGGAYRWNGSQWIPLGELADHDEFKGVHAMNELDGRLVVGGAFDAVDGVPARNIAAWDGASWSALGAGLERNDGANSVYALELFEGRLVAAGDFFNTPGVRSWDGTAWNPLGDTRSCSALAVVGDELIAGVMEYEVQVKAWNGSAWRELGAAESGMVNALLPDGGHVYVGGLFNGFNGQASFGFARWDSLDPLPTATVLSSGWPNPFRETIAFDYQVRAPGLLHLFVRDVTGRRIAIVESAALTAGTGQVRWDARDDAGRKVRAGVYFVTLATPDGARESRKVVLLP